MRVMVIFGGRSGEHEVSLASARAVIAGLEGRHEVVPVGITREGRWLLGGDPMRELEERCAADGETSRVGLPATSPAQLPASLEGDVVFPVLHGPYGEDGRLQGLLEMAGVPYVGSGVLASAVAMDKITMKKVFAYHGLPQVRWLGFSRERWARDRETITREIERSLGYPCFVKPSNLGSSVGINKARDRESLTSAVEEAASLDRRIIVEAAVDAREVEVAVLGNENPDVSVPGEIVVASNDFYDYEAKYTEGKSELHVPAPVDEGIKEEIRRVARSAFEALDAAGMARVDFFLERGTERLLINEINTIPGFTPTSVYARLWAASGLPYEHLLDRLIELALDRHGAGTPGTCA